MTRGSNRLPLMIVAVFIAAFAAGVLLPRLGLFGPHSAVRGPAASRSLLPSFADAGPWIQHPLDADSLRGRIVLLVLWSDTSPLALRLLPNVEGWHLAYARHGVRVIGVHCPDFAFAAAAAVPARIAGRLGLTFPIISDVSYRILGQLQRLPERPSFYIADTSGSIVFETSGDHMAEVDRALRDAIVQAHPGSGVPTGGRELPAPQAPLPRVVYLGTTRVEAGPLSGAEPGYPTAFTTQFRFQEEGKANVPYPVGRWTPGADGLVAARGGADTFVSLRAGPGRISAVLGPPPALTESPRVWILAGDGWLARAAAGDDVRFDARGASYVDVREPRLYSIARCSSECVLRLSPDTEGTTIYSFVIEPPAR